MTADTLRRAADKARSSFPHSDIHRAVADWLDYIARVHEDEAWASCECEDLRHASAVATAYRPETT